jgi:hypothetical protein
METIVTTPVIAVSNVATIADNYLAPAASITGIPCSVIPIITPWFRAVYNHLIAIIKVIIAVPDRQIRPADPYIIAKVYVLMRGNIIISPYIGHIIIISMIISYRSPIGLHANIYTKAYAYLCICRVK